ncbi:MAG: aminopeptidase P family protein [Endomicrobiales bacterium]|nr:aminopeptidase P family protein [Endomicrobiales bacterium]
MFQKRIRKVISKMKAPAYLVTSQADLFYLTGISLEGYWLLITKKGVFGFTNPMLKDQLKSLLPGPYVFSDEKIIELLIKYCKKNKIKTLGINTEHINQRIADKFKKALKIQEENDLIADIRIIKSNDEIEKIGESCKIALKVVKYIENYIKPGLTENQISFKIEELFAKYHAKPSFQPIVASGPNSAWPHHVNSNRKIDKNDIIMVDLGCVHKGYCSDLTRTFFLGKINELQKRVYAVVERAQNKGIKSIKVGLKTNRIDKVTRDVIASGGFGRRFVHSTGHGVGIDIHEPPRINKKDKTVLKPGMVLTVEPGVYLPGKFGVRIEDVVLITKKGYRVLTR